MINAPITPHNPEVSKELNLRLVAWVTGGTLYALGTIVAVVIILLRRRRRPESIHLTHTTVEERHLPYEASRNFVTPG